VLTLDEGRSSDNATTVATRKFANAGEMQTAYKRFLNRQWSIPRPRPAPVIEPPPLPTVSPDAFPVNLDPLKTARRVKQIKLECAEEFGVTLEDIEGPSTKRPKVTARQKAMAMVYAEMHPGWSLPRIGRAFGGRDHTTVLHAVRKLGVWKPSKRIAP
jgi:hypothetical protein